MQTFAAECKCFLFFFSFFTAWKHPQKTNKQTNKTNMACVIASWHMDPYGRYYTCAACLTTQHILLPIFKLNTRTHTNQVRHTVQCTVISVNLNQIEQCIAMVQRKSSKASSQSQLNQLIWKPAHIELPNGSARSLQHITLANHMQSMQFKLLWPALCFLFPHKELPDQRPNYWCT